MGDAKYLVLYYGKDQREELEGWDEIGLQRMTPLEKEYWLVKEAPSVLVVDPSGRVIFQSKGILTTKKEIKKIIQKGERIKVLKPKVYLNINQPQDVVELRRYFSSVSFNSTNY